MKYRDYVHVHVSEREVAHTWPDGRFDDARWEDCTWCALVEVLDFGGLSLPATHAQAELLRAASGKEPLGGSNQTDLFKGAAALYGIRLSQGLAGWDGLKAAMVPGTAAAINGSMSAFPDGSHWRRWDPGFAGAHEWAIFKIDTQPHFWLSDPLAPSSYDGEWVDEATVKAFMDRLDGKYTIVQYGEYGADMKIEFKIEQWKLDGTQTVVTVGAPIKADGNPDYTVRYMVVPGTPGSLETVARSRLTQTAPDNLAIKAAVAAFALPFTKEQVDALTAAARLAGRQEQYDIDAKSVTLVPVAAKLSSTRPT